MPDRVGADQRGKEAQLPHTDGIAVEGRNENPRHGLRNTSTAGRREEAEGHPPLAAHHPHGAQQRRATAEHHPAGDHPETGDQIAHGEVRAVGAAIRGIPRQGERAAEVHGAVGDGYQHGETGSDTAGDTHREQAREMALRGSGDRTAPPRARHMVARAEEAGSGHEQEGEAGENKAGAE